MGKIRSQSPACDHSVCVCLCLFCLMCAPSPPDCHPRTRTEDSTAPTTDKVEMGESAPMTRAGCSCSWLGGGKRSLSTRSSSLPGKSDSRHLRTILCIAGETSLLPLRHRLRSPATERSSDLIRYSPDIHWRARRVSCAATLFKKYRSMLRAHRVSCGATQGTHSFRVPR